jgi:hypothetical protein
VSNDETDPKTLARAMLAHVKAINDLNLQLARLGVEVRISQIDTRAIGDPVRNVVLHVELFQRLRVQEAN